MDSTFYPKILKMNIKIFENEELNSKIRVIEEDSKILFCAKDIALSLGYVNYTHAINTHCKGVVKRDTPTSDNQIQLLNYIYEPDVYRLIFSSKLDNAEKFRDWLFEEVLPSIRRTGTYSISTEVKQLVVKTPGEIDFDNRMKVLASIGGIFSEDYRKKLSIEFIRKYDADYKTNLSIAFSPLDVAVVEQKIQDSSKPAHLLDRAIGSVEYNTHEIADALSIPVTIFYKSLRYLKILKLYYKPKNSNPSGYVVMPEYEYLVRQELLVDKSVRIVKGFYYSLFPDDLKKLIQSTALGIISKQIKV